MDPLLAAHLLFLGAWMGILAVEGIVELGARDGEALRRAAELHYWIDLLAEGPVLVGLTATGAALLARAWPPPPWLAVKVAAAATAIALNFACIGVVVRRHRAADDPERLARSSRHVRWFAIAGAPFFLVAVVLGLARLRG